MDETLPSWVGTDLIENGDFEDNPVTGASGWGLFDAIPGWIAIQGDLEIQKGRMRFRTWVLRAMVLLNWQAGRTPVSSRQ